MNVNLELLVADLAHKLKYRQILPESPNLEADLRGIIASNQQPEPVQVQHPTAKENHCGTCGLMFTYNDRVDMAGGVFYHSTDKCSPVRKPAALTSPAASGNMGALEA